MSNHRNRHRFGNAILLLACGLALQACQSSLEPQHGTLDWYVSNGTGSSLVLNIYDKICRRNVFRFRVPRNGEVPITTCANSDGRAEIRYRYSGGYNGRQNPWLDSVMNTNQVLVVR